MSSYTKFILFDQAINSNKETVKYKQYLIEHELKNVKTLIIFGETERLN